MTLIGTRFEDLLNFLEGMDVSLPIKGSKVLKVDNPFILMTSNRDLRDMVRLKFGASDPTSLDYRYDTLAQRVLEIDVSDGCI